LLAALTIASTSSVVISPSTTRIRAIAAARSCAPAMPFPPLPDGESTGSRPPTRPPPGPDAHHPLVPPHAPEGWPRANVFGRCPEALFGGKGLMRVFPHAGGDRPMQGQRRDEEQTGESVRVHDPAALQAEAAALEVGKH